MTAEVASAMSTTFQVRPPLGSRPSDWRRDTSTWVPTVRRLG